MIHREEVSGTTAQDMYDAYMANTGAMAIRLLTEIPKYEPDLSCVRLAENTYSDLDDMYR